MTQNLRRSIAAATLFLLTLLAAPAPAPSAEQLLAETIRFHDPGSAWGRAAFSIALEESRPDGLSRQTRLTFDPPHDVFRLQTERDGHQIDLIVRGDVVEATLDGSTEFSEEDAHKYRLSPDRARWIRNYYLYLYGLPMKFRDNGAHLDPNIVREPFEGRDAWKLRITYDPETGEDIWYVWIDPNDYRMLGYGFHHDEAKQDGEIVTLEGLVETAGLRLPRARRWNVTADGRHLGTDTIVDP
jgi:hypothetical protein